MTDIKISLALTMHVTVDETHYKLDAVLRLLNEVQKCGNLRIAANRCGYSYRKAWDSLKQVETLFDATLVKMHRGKGSELSPLGQKLLEIEHENKRFFNDALTTAADKAQNALQALLPAQQKLRIIASDSEKLSKLRQQQLPVSLQIEGSSQALVAYAEGKCDMAGFHIAVDEGSKAQLNQFSQYLDQKNDQFILLEQRQQGLMSHPERPVDTLQQLIDQKLLFVNRQTGSGTRLLMDNLLKNHHIRPQQLQGYYHEEHTHLAVASMIISRQADAGLGIESVAKSLNLHFAAITREYYFLVFRSLTPELKHVLNRLDEQFLTQLMDYNAFVKTILNPLT